MPVKYVPDEGGLLSGEGFVTEEGLRLVRVPRACIQIMIDRPMIEKTITYSALKDALLTETSPSFPGQQHSKNLLRSSEIVIRGKGSIEGFGALIATSLSTLGNKFRFTEMEVRLQSAFCKEGEEITGFSVDWFPEEYLPPDGGFVLDGCLAHEDIEFLAAELQGAECALSINLSIGCFPGFFGEWSFEGWIGGELRFADRKICLSVVENHNEMPRDFLSPERPFNTDVYTVGPHKLVEFVIVTQDA